MVTSSAPSAKGTAAANSVDMATLVRTGDLYKCTIGEAGEDNKSGDKRPALFASNSSTSWRCLASLAYLSQSLRAKITSTRTISKHETAACAQYTGTNPIWTYKTKKATDPMLRGSSKPIERNVDNTVRRCIQR